MASIAASDASKLAKLIKAKPFEFPVVGSRIIYNEKNNNEIRKLEIVIKFYLGCLKNYTKC